MMAIRRIIVLLPTVAAALMSLFRDESLLFFVKRVGLTYVSFAAMASILGLLWGASRPCPDHRAGQTAGDSKPRESSVGGPPRGNEPQKHLADEGVGRPAAGQPPTRRPQNVPTAPSAAITVGPGGA